jgi:hypothetical protein
MPVTVYKSSDASAPVLNGMSGALIDVFTKILVTGYGSKAAAGWTTEFSGQDMTSFGSGTVPSWRVFKPGAGLMQPYMRVQDDAPNTNYAGGREARIWGIERAVSGVQDNLLAPRFPTAAQAANGIILRKSATYDSTSRPWVCVADARTMYFFAFTGDYEGWGGFCFGEIYSIKSSADNYNSIIIGRVVEQLPATPTALGSQENLESFAAVTTVITGHWMPRSWSESAATACAVGKHGHSGHSATNMFGLFSYPHQINGALELHPIWVIEPSGQPILRGRMRGLWHFLHPVVVDVNDGDTFAGTGPLAGKTFLVVKPTAQGLGVYVIETSNTWETN